MGSAVNNGYIQITCFILQCISMFVLRTENRKFPEELGKKKVAVLHDVRNACFFLATVSCSQSRVVFTRQALISEHNAN